MGKIIINPPKPVVRVKVSPKNFQKVYALAIAVHAGILANVGTFAHPVVTMVNFNNDITALASAIAALGYKFNKNGKAALTTCINASELVYTDLVQLANYVTNVVTTQFRPILFSRLRLSHLVASLQSPQRAKLILLNL